MKFVKTTASLVEITMDPSIVKFNGQYYVVFSYQGQNLTLVLRSEYDIATEELLDVICSADKFINSLKGASNG